jgi:hypothetical protein
MLKPNLTSIFSPILVLALAALTPACAGLQPPVRSSGPAAATGVEVAVLRQHCSYTVEAEQPGNDLVEAVIEVEVRNATPVPVTVHRDRFRLRAPDGSAIRTATWFSGEPLPVVAGRPETFQLRFMTRGGLSCSKEMQLDASAALTQGDQPLKIGSVTFQPSRML